MTFKGKYISFENNYYTRGSLIQFLQQIENCYKTSEAKKTCQLGEENVYSLNTSDRL